MTLITGASGFIGGFLLSAIKSEGIPLSLWDSCWVQEVARYKPYAIVHLAGLSHSQGTEREIWNVNADVTKTVATEAVRNSVKRFVYVSSIQAIGEKTTKGVTLGASDTSFSRGAYGRSKYEAEQFLRALSMKSSMEVVIIRPPLVYGPGVKANFRNLFKQVDKGFSLPISALDINRRSYVAVSNLIDLILLCLEHPAAANQTFHVSDNDDISTSELLRRMGKALGKPVRNLPIPGSLLRGGLRLVGKGEWVDKLCGDLRVDVSKTMRLLGWKPKVTMEEELERTARWWRESRQGRL